MTAMFFNQNRFWQECQRIDFAQDKRHENKIDRKHQAEGDGYA